MATLLRLYILIGLNFIVTLSFAQKENWKWYFGYGAAMDFSSGVPVPLYNSAMYQWEGSASISDVNGDLLFYTNGIDAWNKNHVQMPNGFGMLGEQTSTQSALIVKKPGSSTIYYIFSTNGAAAHYSEVDLSLQGGLGDVTDKNILLSANSTEKLAAVLADNGQDIWVALHENGSSNFNAFLVSSTGVNPVPVISSVGNVLYEFIGQLKFSHDGKKAAYGTFNAANSESIELFDFDNATGIFSNGVGIPTPYDQTYGIEFSPNNKILYTTSHPDNNQVHQWNLDAGSLADIIASDTVIGPPNGYIRGSLQLAPDGKIYVAQEGNIWLCVINYPDSLGAACEFNSMAVDLSPNSVGLGLPNFVAGNLNVALQAELSSIDTSGCGIFCTDFFDLSSGNPDSWLWTFPGGNPATSTLQNPTNICYAVSGNYNVILIVANSSGSDTITVPNYIQVTAAPVVSINQSNDTLYSSLADSYQWYNGGNAIGGATDEFYIPASEDYYSVVVTDSNGCTATDTIFFSLAPQTAFDAADTLICEKFCVDYFDLSTNNATSWQWSFPGGNPASSSDQDPTQICYNVPGIYDVTLITTNGFGSDTLTLVNYITVNPTPPFPSITQSGNVLTSSPAAAYQWQFNSSDIPGATMQSYTYTQPGLYTVQVYDSNGCSNNASVVITTLETIGTGFSVSVFENPDEESLTIEFNNAVAGDEVAISIINMVGQKIFSTHEIAFSDNWKIVIDTHDFPAGVYLTNVECKTSRVTKKIVKS